MPFVERCKHLSNLRLDVSFGADDDIGAIVHYEKGEKNRNSLRFLHDGADIVQSGNEAAAVGLLGTARAVREADDLGVVLFQSYGKAEPLRVEDKRDESFLVVRIVAHEDRHVTAVVEDALASEEQEVIAIQECRSSDGQADKSLWIVGVFLLPPIGRMEPNEVELADSFVARRIAGIATLADVEADAFDPEFSAYVGASAGAGHGIENSFRPEVQQQILDEFARNSCPDSRDCRKGRHKPCDKGSSATAQGCHSWELSGAPQSPVMKVSKT